MVLCSVAVLAAACNGGGSSGATGSTRSTAGGTTLPVKGASAEFVAHRTDWVLPGRDYDNSRATFDSAIDAGDVQGLTPGWEATLGGQLTTVPLIVGDTVYVQDGSGVIAAVDRETGRDRWRTAAYGLNIGPFGVAVAGGRVYGMHGSTGVVAVDAATGSEVWTRDITATPTSGIDIQPVAFDGMVFVSTVPVSVGGIYTAGDRGIISALDAATGEPRWTFDTVEGDLWGHPEINSGGGAWYPPSIDPEQRVVYWGTANPAPFVGTPEFPNGASRPGPNLYTDSTLAIDIDTGKLRWYHQVHPHDLFDRDLVHTMITRFADGGRMVIATGKGGIVVGLDPATGEQRWSTPVGVHNNDQLSELSGPTKIEPGTFGGVITPPATADGKVYVAAVNAPTTLEPATKSYIGSQTGQADGEVVALDAKTGAVDWVTKVPGDPFGAATVVNDLVFTALVDGQILALDRATGAIVWRTKAPDGINGWMSVAGDQLIVPVGMATPPKLVSYHLPRRS